MKYKDHILQRRGEFLAQFAPVTGQPRPLAVLIAPLKSHSKTVNGGRLNFTHLWEMPVFVSEEMYYRICDKFADRLMLADQIEGATAVMAGLMGYTDTGTPVLHEAALMVVTGEWLPVENARDVQVINLLVQMKRRFVRQLRFTLKPEVPISTAVLTDTSDPDAIFVTPPHDMTDSSGRMRRAAEEGVYPYWLWDGPTSPPCVSRTAESIRGLSMMRIDLEKVSNNRNDDGDDNKRQHPSVQTQLTVKGLEFGINSSFHFPQVSLVCNGIIHGICQRFCRAGGLFNRKACAFQLAREFQCIKGNHTHRAYIGFLAPSGKSAGIGIVSVFIKHSMMRGADR